MTSRAALYAHAARNQVGRLVGAQWAYTPAQRAVAKAMWDVFKASGYDDDSAAALLGCVDGECSFLLTARGDHGEAGGVAQWHRDRRDLIFEHANIDVWAANDGAKQAAAIVAEISPASHAWSHYYHVDGMLRMAKGIRPKMMVLVAHLEQSGQQSRDIERRTPMAVYWLKTLGGPPPSEDQT